MTDMKIFMVNRFRRNCKLGKSLHGPSCLTTVLFFSDTFPCKLQNKKQERHQVKNKVKDVDGADQLSSQEHPNFFQGMGFRYKWSKSQKNSGNKQQGCRYSLKPLHTLPEC